MFRVLFAFARIPCSLLQDEWRDEPRRSSKSEGGLASAQFRFDTQQLAAGSFILRVDLNRLFSLQHLLSISHCEIAKVQGITDVSDFRRTGFHSLYFAQSYMRSDEFQQQILSEVTHCSHTVNQPAFIVKRVFDHLPRLCIPACPCAFRV